MNTLTPETDAATYGLRDEVGIKVEVVNSDFARQLELQRDQARKTCAELVTDGNAITLAGSLHKMEKERDELRRVCDGLANNRIMENILADGRPHGSNRTYPDGCECDDCTAYDQIIKALSTYDSIARVIAK